MNFPIFLAFWGTLYLVTINPGEGDEQKSNSPPYNLIFDRFEVFNNTEKMFINSNLRVKKFNRTTYVLTGEFETLHDFNDDFSAIFRASSESGNEYKIIHSQRADNLCSFLIDNDVVYPDLVNFSNLPKNEPGMCPIPKNKFVISNYFITESKLPEKLPSGDKWRFDIIAFERTEISVAISIYINVERKLHKY